MSRLLDALRELYGSDAAEVKVLEAWEADVAERDAQFEARARAEHERFEKRRQEMREDFERRRDELLGRP